MSFSVLARLLREARAMAKLSHPNVGPVFEADTTGGQTFVVMELVAGQTLRHWMRRVPSPDWRQCVKVFIQAGQGLAAAHARGLVHRDFKPSNAIVDDEGRTRVLDFGLARRTVLDMTEHEEDQTDDRPPQGPHARGPARGTMATRDDEEPTLYQIEAQTLTETGVVMGTPAYMPPEQMKGCEADARSDQFSFCVSLYEAIYGERPFQGGTLTELMDAMNDGTVRPAPKGCPVPTRLRTILLQGLAAQPEQRWPSMDALLHQLRTLVAPRSARWMAVGVTAGLAALGGGLALGQYVELKERCTGAQAHMDGLWDDDRRQQVQAAILSTERSFATGTWERIEPRLSAYARDWQDKHTEVCEATSVRGEQSEEALDLRMRCLGERRAALRATVDVLADADDEVITHAIEMVADLPPLTRCDDLHGLEQRNQRVPPPEDPDVAVAVQTQRARLAQIEAMDKAGLYAEALDAAGAVVEQAQALGYPPLQAEALYWRGTLRSRNGQYAEAEVDLQKAHALAMGHHHDPVALDAAQALTSLVGSQLTRHAEGRQWGRMAALPLAQRSGEPTETAHSLVSLGLVYESQGDYDTARDHHERALVIFEQALGPDHPQVARSLESLGGVFYGKGDMDNARAHHERALEILERALGPDHPQVATSVNKLGTVIYRQGDYQTAQRHYQRALEIRQRALGPGHPEVGTSLNNLGNRYYDQGDMDNARVHYERAIAIFERALGPDHPKVALSLNNLGNLYGRQENYEQAGVHHQRAFEIRQKALGPDHRLVAISLNNLGSVSQGQGDLPKARAQYERALTIFEKVMGPDHPHVAYSLGDLATVALEMGDPASARAYAERAVSVREAANVEPVLLAEARFILAKALWPAPSERARARALAKQAKTMAAAVGTRGQPKELIDKAEAWLATHRVK
ncbi:MAG: tetratricopeptide repeat protein [Myxococcota bacterium]